MHSSRETLSVKKDIRNLAKFYTNAIAIGGDLTPNIADELLDDLTTDGNQLYYDKTHHHRCKTYFPNRQYSMDIPPY